jgi:hypothetical protein
MIRAYQVRVGVASRISTELKSLVSYSQSVFTMFKVKHGLVSYWSQGWLILYLQKSIFRIVVPQLVLEIEVIALTISLLSILNCENKKGSKKDFL